MHINLFLIPFVIILGLLFSQSNSKRSRQWYIIICSLVLMFVASMRHPVWMTETYGIDTQSYLYMFESTFDMSWSELMTEAYIRYFGVGGESDVGYLVLNKIIGYFTHDFGVFSFIADFLFFYPFGLLLFRYTTNVRQLIFAFVFYISLIQVFLLGGGRQMFAIGMDLMALLAVIDRKKTRAIFLFLLGVTLHFSSFLFLVPLLMVWYDVKPKTIKQLHLLCFIVFPIVFLIPNQVISIMGGVAGVEKYAEYGKHALSGGSIVFIGIIELLSFFCLIAIKEKDMLLDKKIVYFYIMAPFFTFFAPLIRSNGTMIRIALYYYIFLSLLVPFSIDCYLKQSGNKSITYWGVIFALALLTIITDNIEYYFYWQL